MGFFVFSLFAIEPRFLNGKTTHKNLEFWFLFQSPNEQFRRVILASELEQQPPSKGQALPGSPWLPPPSFKAPHPTPGPLQAFSSAGSTFPDTAPTCLPVSSL